MNRYLAARLADVPESRRAQQHDVSELMLRFENADRYFEQSARTRNGQRAEPGPRPVATRELRPA